MSDEGPLFRLKFRRGFNEDTGDGYYEMIVTDNKTGKVVLQADATYEGKQPIFLCDVCNVSIEELGKNFPGSNRQGDFLDPAFRALIDGKSV